MKRYLLLLILSAIFMSSFSQTVFEDSFEINNTNENPPYSWICDTDGWLAGEGTQSHNREPHSGNWYAYINWGSDHWMYKEMELEAGETYEFSMWYRTDGSTGFSMEVAYGNDSQPSAMINPIFPLNTIDNEEYIELKETFLCNNSGTFYLGIHCLANNDPWYMTIDDVKLRKVNDYSFEMRRLNADTLIYAGETHDYLIEIENTGLNDDEYDLTDLLFDWEAAFYHTDGTGPITNIDVAAFETETILLRQSVPSNGIEFGETSETYANVVSVGNSHNFLDVFTSTALTPYSGFPLIEGFEEELFPPLGWQASIENGDENFKRITEGEYPTCFPHDNSLGMAWYQSFSAQSGETALLISPELVLNSDDFIVRFWVYRTDDIDNKADKFEIYLSEDMELNNAELLGSIHRTISMEPVETTEGWFEYSYEFSGTNENKYIIFRAVSAYGWNMYIDDIKIALNEPDTEAPEFISVNDLIQYADLEMPVELVIRDDSDVPETLTGIYNIGNGNEEFELNKNGKSKANYIFTGMIPAHPDQTSGTVKFLMEDIHGNSSETDLFDIEWNGIAPLLEESFEGDFLPEGWTQVMAPYTWFVWSRVDEEDYTDSDGVEYVVTPPHGEYQAMVGWDFQGNEQDEWLISPEVEITDLADLTFETFAQIGSFDYDHFVVSIQANNGPWEEKWNAFYMDNHVIQYDETIEIPLDEYLGQSIKIAWRAYNPMYDNLWYAWFIDDVKVSKRTNVSVNEIKTNSSFDFSFLSNPIQDQLTILIPDPSSNKSVIKITDMNGKVVYFSETNSQNQIQINTTELQSGVYICTLIQGSELKSKLFVKQ